MQKVLLVMPVILPVFFWAVYHYHKDRHLPEPPGHLLLTFVLGVLAAAVSQALYMALDPLALRFDAGALSESSSLGLFAYSLLAIGPIEEFSKLLFFVLIVIQFKEFDEPLDGIIYASFIGLGYAAIENWQYLDYLTPLEAAARGFASPVVHMLFASIWGYWIARATLADQSVLRAGVVGFAIAATLHCGSPPAVPICWLAATWWSPARSRLAASCKTARAARSSTRISRRPRTSPAIRT